jgi:uncharacterized membrane protein YcgQ (UPF0703/DUF1980 family)
MQGSTLCNMVLQTQLHNLACYCRCHWQVYLYAWLMMQWLQSLIHPITVGEISPSFGSLETHSLTYGNFEKLWIISFLSLLESQRSKISQDSTLKAKSLMISWCVLMDSSSLGVIIMPKMEALINIWHRDLRAGIQISNALWLLCMLLDMDDDCSF